MECIKIDSMGREVVRAFFGAAGGVSTGVYKSLNCGFGSQDKPENVRENRTRVADSVSLPPDHLVTLNQVHGKACVLVEKPWAKGEEPKADAMVTTTPGIGLGILTADCAPVLLSGHDQSGEPVIGAIHAGWRGALAGIIESTVQTMVKQGVDIETVQAVIGPCIQRQSYEVDSDFKERFISQDEGNSRFFKKHANKDKWLFDLSGYLVRQLEQCGVTDTIILDNDTYVSDDRYFSHRRNRHENTEDYGRQISVVAIRPAKASSE